MIVRAFKFVFLFLTPLIFALNAEAADNDTTEEQNIRRGFVDKIEKPLSYGNCILEGLEDSKVPILIEVLKAKNKEVKRLILNGPLSDLGAEMLAEGLKDNFIVKDLGIIGCQIGDRGAKALLKVIKDNYAILNLNIQSREEISQTILKEISHACYLNFNYVHFIRSKNLDYESLKDSKTHDEIKKIYIKSMVDKKFEEEFLAWFKTDPLLH
jgi:hypothetical protein